MTDPEKLHQVAALTAAGKSTRQIEALTGIPRATANRYQSLDEVGRIINELRPSILARLSERMWKMVDNEQINLKPIELGTLWGIASDKELKAQALDHPTQDNRQLIIVIPGMSQEPVTIDIPSTQISGDSEAGSIETRQLG